VVEDPPQGGGKFLLLQNQGTFGALDQSRRKKKVGDKDEGTRGESHSGLWSEWAKITIQEALHP